MASQRLLERRPQGKPLLAQRRQTATDATKAGNARLSAKTARDFLLNLDHAQIAFGLIVGQSRQLHRLPL